MRLLLVALGSRGDVVPVTALAPALLAAGHKVTIAANPEFAALVGASGAGFMALRGDARSVSTFPDGWRRSPRFLAEQAAALSVYLTGAVDDLVTGAAGYDALLPNFTAMAAHDIAEGLGVPSLGLFAQPVEPTSAFPSILLHTARSFGRIGNRLTGRAALAAATPLRAASRRARAAFGLSRRSTRPKPGVLHGYSPHVLPRPVDWRPGLDVVGYWTPQLPPNWHPPAEVVDFLDAGPAPIVVSFGSMGAGQGERLSEAVATAVRGRRAIVQRGWAGLEVDGDDVLMAGDLPHRWLFPRAAAVIHHGGAGTAGAVFICGVPSVAVPVYADQPLWGERARRLGTGPPPLPLRSLTGPALAARIDAALGPACRRAAEKLSRAIATDDGTGRVVEAVAKLDRSN